TDAVRWTSKTDEGRRTQSPRDAGAWTTRVRAPTSAGWTTRPSAHAPRSPGHSDSDGASETSPLPLVEPVDLHLGLVPRHARRPVVRPLRPAVLLHVLGGVEPRQPLVVVVAGLRVVDHRIGDHVARRVVRDAVE